MITYICFTFRSISLQRDRASVPVLKKEGISFRPGCVTCLQHVLHMSFKVKVMCNLRELELFYRFLDMHRKKLLCGHLVSAVVHSPMTRADTAL